MARNLEAINKVRVGQGLPVLDKLPESAAPVQDPPLQDPPPPPPVRPADANAPPKTEKTEEAEPEIDDAKLFAALGKRGVNITSLEELLPKVDPEKSAEQKEAAKLSYALSQGLFTTREYEKFVREKNNPRDLVFAEYHEAAKKEDPDMDDADIQAEFEEKYGMTAPVGSRKFNQGVKEIGLLADQVLQSRYKNIFAADGAYSQYATQEQTKQETARKLLAGAPAYKKDVEQIFTDLAKLKIMGSDTDSYEVEVPAEALQTMKGLFLSSDQAAEQILKGYDKEALKQLAYTALVKENFQVLAMQVAAKYHLARQAGSKGIPPTHRLERKEGRQLTDNQRTVLAANGIKEEDLPPVVAN